MLLLSFIDILVFFIVFNVHIINDVYDHEIFNTCPCLINEKFTQVSRFCFFSYLYLVQADEFLTRSHPGEVPSYS